MGAMLWRDLDERHRAHGRSYGQVEANIWIMFGMPLPCM